MSYNKEPLSRSCPKCHALPHHFCTSLATMSKGDPLSPGHYHEERAFLHPRVTQRGFKRVDFSDFYGVECSLQDSSLATESAIWLGCNEPRPRVLIPGKGWTDIELPRDSVSNTRMHLTQAQVKELLPLLTYFAENGYLPEQR